MPGWVSLGNLADISAVLTALVAVVAYLKYLWDRRAKRVRVEQYLRDEKAKDVDKGQRTVLHLARKLHMAEQDVRDAAFSSKLVQSRVDEDEEGRAKTLYFEFKS